jgi:hypothetical protein
MLEKLHTRETALRQFFGLAPDANLLRPDAPLPDVSPTEAAHLERYNFEWHLIPAADAVPFDDAYLARLYPQRTRDFARPDYHGESLQEALTKGHRRHQGLLLGIETTLKPHYHHNNRQFYGTIYGYDATADPFASYLGQAGFANGTRYAHNYVPLRALVTRTSNDWRARALLPKGYRLTLCPPAVFNLIGTLFHPEWSATETLELGFYRDEKGNAHCFAVGSNAPGDYSFLQRIETDSDWTYLGFRLALVPEFV